MTPVRRLFIGAVVVLSGTVGYVAGRAFFRPVDRVAQPIAFSHQKHAGEMELECSLCHAYFATGRHAGLPALETCAECHAEVDPDLPEASKITEMIAAGRNDVFRKLFRLPDHVYYAHRTHVIKAKLECRNCHGEIAQSTAPPDRPLKRIDMEFCIDCHERSDVRSECTSCHR